MAISYKDSVYGTTPSSFINEYAPESELVINMNSRKVLIPPELKTIGLVADNNSETVVIRVPSTFFDEITLEDKLVYINYINAGNQEGTYTITHKEVEEDTLKLFWTIDRKVTKYAGMVKFQVVFELDDNYKWSSQVGRIKVREGLKDKDTEGEIDGDDSEITPSVLQQINDRFTDINANLANLSDALNNKADKNEIPSLDNKVDKEDGKSLSSNDFTDAYINKINDTETGLSDMQDSLDDMEKSLGSLSPMYDHKLSELRGANLPYYEITDGMVVLNDVADIMEKIPIAESDLGGLLYYNLSEAMLRDCVYRINITKSYSKMDNMDGEAEAEFVPYYHSYRDMIDMKADKADIESKVDKVEGKGLSTNDYTDTDKNKVSAISRSATFVIAASNSSEKSRAGADYVCTGSNDEVIINQAIANLPSVGGKITLMEGVYSITDNIIINKSLHFEGISRDNTILLSQNDNVVTKLTVGNVEINGLKFKRDVDLDLIEDSGDDIYMNLLSSQAIQFGTKLSNVIIRDCTFREIGYAVTGRGTFSNIMISGNIFDQMVGQAICIHSDTRAGYAESEDIIISNNITTSPKHFNGGGLAYLWGCKRANIIGNNCDRIIVQSVDLRRCSNGVVSSNVNISNDNPSLHFFECTNMVVIQDSISTTTDINYEEGGN